VQLLPKEKVIMGKKRAQKEILDESKVRVVEDEAGCATKAPGDVMEVDAGMGEFEDPFEDEYESEDEVEGEGDGKLYFL
jgi:hypothetical protein